MTATLTLIAASLLGCSSALDGDTIAGVGQAGAQDFGQFRQILDEGGIPGPGTLDDVGFFNEHVIPMPAPDCGADVCLHAMYGAMANMVSGSPCTVLLLGMNTTVTPESLVRPPLDLTLVLDDSEGLPSDAAVPLAQGLTSMLDALQPDDRVSVVRYSSEAVLFADALAPGRPELELAFRSLGSERTSDLYSGLRLGLDHAERIRRPEAQSRVVLVSGGARTSGITSATRVRELARVRAETGISLTTIGLGTAFDVGLLRDIAEIGGGAFYFLEDVEALQEVFTEEVDVFLSPIAEDARITVLPDEPWDARELYGTELYQIPAPQVDIQLPTLQIAGRTSASDDYAGRRGGGGALVLEMLPAGTGALEGAVGTIDFSYRIPYTDELVTQQIVPMAEPMVGDRWFQDQSVEKAFVMLNLFVGFDMAATSAAAGDDGAALVVLENLALNVDLWLQDTPDPDIADDLVYVRRFIDNLQSRSPFVQRPGPDEPWWPRD